MVAIFPKLCFWRRSLCSNLGGIDPEKLYRATLRGHRTEFLMMVLDYVLEIRNEVSSYFCIYKQIKVGNER